MSETARFDLRAPARNIVFAATGVTGTLLKESLARGFGRAHLLMNLSERNV